MKMQTSQSLRQHGTEQEVVSALLLAILVVSNMSLATVLVMVYLRLDSGLPAGIGFQSARTH